MKTNFLNTIAIVAAVSLVSANVALAGGKGKGGGGGGGGGGSNHSSSLKVSLGGGGGGNNSNHSNIGKAIALGALSLNNGNNNGGQCHNNGGCNNGGQCHNNGGCNNGGQCNNNGGCNGGGYGNGQSQVNNDGDVGRAFEPFHSNYVTLPGDSFYTISLKEYSTSANAKYIARFNNIPQEQILTPGTIIQLPAIAANGRLSGSHSPAADELRNNTTGSPVANFSSTGATATNFTTTPNTPPTVEAPRP